MKNFVSVILKSSYELDFLVRKNFKKINLPKFVKHFSRYDD